MLKNEKLLFIRKRDRNWIEAFVPYEQEQWRKIIKKIDGRKYDKRSACWLLPYVKQTFYHLRDYIKLSNIIFDFKIETKIPDRYKIFTENQLPKKTHLSTKYDELNEAQQRAVFSVEEFLTLKRYRYSTISTYRSYLVALFYHYKNIKPENIHKDHVQKYLYDQIKIKRISVSTQNQFINAFKIYSEKILKRPKEFVEIIRPKKPRKLPGVLSVHEIVRLISTLTNLKHKLAIMLIYSSGLRVSEVVSLLISDIQIDRRVIHIKDGKGRKDRYVVLAETIIPFLEAYRKEYRPSCWLFEGQYGGKYSCRSLQNVFSLAKEKSKIDPYATLHTLRHSYATHCLENGHNLKTIQEALGHKSLKTTELYLHVCSEAMKKLKSPIDTLKFK